MTAIHDCEANHCIKLQTKHMVLQKKTVHLKLKKLYLKCKPMMQ